ncbi:MAG: potassium channel family protein [SAR202 cluster bacterium]|nr:potassium channel family protein [SAR202 cluster bacterium]
MKLLSRLHVPHVEDRDSLLARIERLTELPLIVLAFAMIPLLVGDRFWDLSESEKATFQALQYFIWGVFVADMLAKIAVAPNKLQYIRSHWIEVVIVAVPFFRPLNILRLFLFGTRVFVGARRMVKADFLLVYGIGLVLIAATVMTSVEKGNNANITSFPDALWWAVVTVTTVGYGDKFPVTAIGRAVAFVLMLGGIAFFSGITANLASFMMRGDDPTKASLAHLTEEIRRLRQELAQRPAEPPPSLNS